MSSTCDGDAASDDPSSSSIPFSHSNSRQQDRLLLEPITYILKVPGKNVRWKLLHAFNVWLKVTEERLCQIGEVVNLLHNASLLIDDIEDNSVLRRGVPVAHKIYGVASTINSANYAMFIGLERVLQMGSAQAVNIYSEQMLELHRGQGMEIYWRDNYICPSEEEYRLMTVRKTGGLFNLAVRLMQNFSPVVHERDFVELTTMLGLYFQIRDDYANLCLEKYAANKTFAEDLTEGKFSFPIVYAIRNNPDDSRVLNILRQRTRDLDVKRYCVSVLDSLGSFSYTKSVMAQLDQQIRNEIQNLGGNDILLSLLDDLKDWS